LRLELREDHPMGVGIISSGVAHGIDGVFDRPQACNFRSRGAQLGATQSTTSSLDGLPTDANSPVQLRPYS
jgi:hypothetical protein